ncbi:PREDICTED: zinc finger CCCH domain-containing protein 15-like [Elephantulus edwardii]|uniref:zinc finger CCCH domain-containing protein 15-like n=1 Tax=Elephantulus edwardii TaxID=28737 RepID=UPI0003F0F216|nr:PREDICTED: zinc finger CCCH domain-containing protein 15-like [Elephantulus edwardii]
MPPKKQAQSGGSKKAEQKKKEKIIEDKTFGLKNKKGAKQQKFIKAVTHQVKFGQQNPRQVAQSEAEKKLKKDDKKKELQELNELFKPVVAAQKISKGADPKSVDNEGAVRGNGAIDAVPVDENLFTGEDLDELEEELNTLDLEE